MTIVKPVVVVGIVDKQPSVLRFAARQAELSGAMLHVVHAASLSPIVADFGSGIDAVEATRVTGQSVLDDAWKFVQAELGNPPAEFILTSAGAIEALERACVGAHMLVVGADDVPWYARLLQSRVAGFLALHASCPVVVVPEVAYPGSMEGDVVVTLDGDSSANGPLRFGFEQASARDTVLHVLHTVPPATTASDVADLRANMSHVLAKWREVFPDVAVMDGVAVGHPKEIVARATSGAELVVLGRPHSTMPFAISRPLATSVLRQANCAVAVVPGDYRGV